MDEVLGGNPEFVAGNCFFDVFCLIGNIVCLTSLKCSRNSIDCTCFQYFETGELEDEFTLGMESLQIAAQKLQEDIPRKSQNLPFHRVVLRFMRFKDIQKIQILVNIPGGQWLMISMRRSLKSLTIGHRPFF